MSGGTDGATTRPGRPEYAIIAGFGLPGRAVADALDLRGVPFCVIELNVHTVSRCLRTGIRIIEGDAADADVLRRAQIDRATLFAITLPDEETTLKAVALARSMNATMRILARCTYMSTGLKAATAGADEVVVAENAVAAEFSRLLSGAAKPSSR